MVSSLPVHCPLVKLYCHYILNIDLPGATDTQLDCIMCVYVNEWEKIKGGGGIWSLSAAWVCSSTPPAMGCYRNSSLKGSLAILFQVSKINLGSYTNKIIF